MFTLTLEASHVASLKGFEDVIACLRNVRDAWQVVARDPEAQKLLPRDLRSGAERYAKAGLNSVSASLLAEDSAPTKWSA